MKPQKFCHVYYFDNGDWMMVEFGDKEDVNYNLSENNNVKISLRGETDCGLVVTRYVAENGLKYDTECSMVVVNFDNVNYAEMG